MTKQELIKRLQTINERGDLDPEIDHTHKDELLLWYINDKRVTEEFRKGRLWYA